MSRYEGLFIFNTAGKEEGVKEVTDRVAEVITSVGGQVQSIQRMDKRPFSRVADKKVSSGHYVNFIFDAEPAALEQLKGRFDMDEEVFRVLFTHGSPEAKAA